VARKKRFCSVANSDSEAAGGYSRRLRLVPIVRGRAVKRVRSRTEKPSVLLDVLSGVVQARLFAFQDGADPVSTTAPFLAFHNPVVAGFVVDFVLGLIVVAVRNFYF